MATAPGSGLATRNEEAQASLAIDTDIAEDNTEDRMLHHGNKAQQELKLQEKKTKLQQPWSER